MTYYYIELIIYGGEDIIDKIYQIDGLEYKTMQFKTNSGKGYKISGQVGGEGYIELEYIDKRIEYILDKEDIDYYLEVSLMIER